MEFACGTTPDALEFDSTLHVPYAVPPRYVAQSGPLLEPVLGIDILKCAALF